MMSSRQKHSEQCLLDQVINEECPTDKFFKIISGSNDTLVYILLGRLGAKELFTTNLRQ
jgi:hypothetical protein